MRSARKTNTQQYPRASVSLPPRGVLGKNASTLGEEDPQGDAETLLHPAGWDPKCLPQPQRGPGSPTEAVPPHRPITDAASLPSNFQSRHPKPRLALYGCLAPALHPGTPRLPDKPHVLPRSSLPGGDPPSPLGTAPAAGSFALAGAAGWGQDGDRTRAGISALLLGGTGAGGSRLARADSAPAPPQPPIGEELPLLGQPAGTAFPPGEMPTKEFALHSLTPALITGIKLASLFHKSRELISRSPCSARGP